MTGDISELIKQRGSVYGDFRRIAETAQILRATMRDSRGWDDCPHDICEALDMIALKMARIICGDHEYLDNWDDIGGYAKLVADRIRAEEKP